MLKRCATFVVVFNRQFRRIDITTNNETISFEVIERSLPNGDGLQMVTVGETDHEIQIEHRFLLIEREHASVTVPVELSDNGLMCVPLEETPRLFLGFPLIGTETFSFPAVINSFAFTPTENRDGIYLGQSDDAPNKINQKVFKQACKLHVKLLEHAATSRWAGVHELADIPLIQDQPWLNRSWLHERLRRLVTKIRDTPAVRHGDRSMKPNQSVLPVVSETVEAKTLWDLMNAVKALRSGLPERNEAIGWCKTIGSWEPYIDSVRSLSVWRGFGVR